MNDGDKLSIYDSVITGDVTNITQSNRVICESCKAEGNLVIFICSEPDCNNTFCEYCKNSDESKKCNSCCEMGLFTFKLPDIGEGVVEGEVVEWMVSVGDSVKEDDPILSVMTDKATVEIPSPTDGVVKSIVGEPGTILPVGQVCIEFTTEGEGSPKAEPVVEPVVEEVKEVAPEKPELFEGLNDLFDKNINAFDVIPNGSDEVSNWHVIPSETGTDWIAVRGWLGIIFMGIVLGFSLYVWELLSR